MHIPCSRDDPEVESFRAFPRGANGREGFVALLCESRASSPACSYRLRAGCDLMFSRVCKSGIVGYRLDAGNVASTLTATT